MNGDTFLHRVFDPALIASAEDVKIQPGQVVSLLVSRGMHGLWRLTYTPRVTSGLHVNVHVVANPAADPGRKVSLVRIAGPEHPEVRDFFAAAQEEAAARNDRECDRMLGHAVAVLFPGRNDDGAPVERDEAYPFEGL